MNETTYGESNETESSETECGMYETYTLARFLFLSSASAIAILGMGANAFLVHFFISHKSPTTPPTLYPSILAVLDWCMCFMYVLIMGVDAAVFYLSDKNLFNLYHSYIIPSFVVAKITQLAIPYILIFATLERLVWVTGLENRLLLQKMYSVRGRYVTIILSLTICALLRLPIAFAFEIREYPNCDNFFGSKMASTADWANESEWYHYFDFHALVIAQTFIPFGVLLLLNFMVVSRLARVQTTTELENQRLSTCSTELQEPNPSLLSPHRPSSERKPSEKRFSISLRPYDLHSLMPIRRSSRRTNSAVRAAINTMVMIVCSYLISNSLHVILTVLERSKAKILQADEDPALASTFHTAFSDIVSFIYMFTSALRILIYLSCNPTIRTEILERFRKFAWHFKRASINNKHPLNITAL